MPFHLKGGLGVPSHGGQLGAICALIGHLVGDDQMESAAMMAASCRWMRSWAMCNDRSPGTDQPGVYGPGAELSTDLANDGTERNGLSNICHVRRRDDIVQEKLIYSF